MKKKTKLTAPETIEIKDFITAGKAKERFLAQLRDSVSDGPAPGPEFLPDAAPGKVSVICSMPSIGKTALLINIALRLQAEGKNIAVFLTESTPEEFIGRTIIIKNGLEGGQPIRFWRSHDRGKSLEAAAAKLPPGGLYISRYTRLGEICVSAQIKAAAAKFKAAGASLDTVIIDSLNYLCDTAPAELEEPYEPHLYSIREAAAEHNVRVLASLNMRGNPRIFHGQITLADARLAGLREDFLGAIYCLTREEYYRRDDPTVKNMASLTRLYPHLGRGQQETPLTFCHETMVFKPVTQCLNREPVFIEEY